MKHGSPNVAFIYATSGNTDIATVDANACHASGQANARLIAAAPDMLNVLQTIITRLDMEPTDAVFWNSCYVLRENIRKAIRKAGVET